MGIFIQGEDTENADDFQSEGNLQNNNYKEKSEMMQMLQSWDRWNIGGIGD